MLSGGPANLVVVEVVEGIRERDVGRVFVVGNALEVKVGLGSFQIHTNPFVINFVLDIREQDEGGNDTLTTRGLHSSLNISVPHVSRGREQGSGALLGHGEKHSIAVVQRLSLADPGSVLGITEVVSDVDNGVHIIEGSGRVLANGSRNA